MTSIVIGGDIVPSFKNIEYFASGDVTKIADEACRKVLENADIRIFNLETPITETHNPILKEGANFSIPRLCINGINALGANVVSLANNHCKDQGEAALLETIELLNSSGIKTVGYGKKGIADLSCTYMEKHGLKIAIIACAETEFTIASEWEYGAIPYDAFRTNKMIKEAKEGCNAVIVLYHGGKEYYKYPTPNLQERCRLMIDSGADIVLCQHSHCIGCREQYNSGEILYGQGNFIFHQKNNRHCTKEGLLAKIDIYEDKREICFLPVILNDEDMVCLAKSDDSKRIMDEFNERTQKIKEPGKVAELFSGFADEMLYGYLCRLKRPSMFERILRKTELSSKIGSFTRKELLAILNLLQNEAHRELFIQSLKNAIAKEE